MARISTYNPASTPLGGSEQIIGVQSGGNVTITPEMLAHFVRNAVFIDSSDSPYSATAWDIIFCDTSTGSIEILLPAGAEGHTILIYGDATSGTNNITITPDGSETIDNDVEFVIDQHWGQVNAGYDAANTNWVIAITGTPDVVMGTLVFDDLNDVDMTTNPPVIRNKPVFNGTNWVPVQGECRNIWTGNMNDDTAVSIALGAEYFNGNIIIVSNEGGSRAILAFRAAASGNFCHVIAGTDIAASTSVLTGTTGSDGTVTVSVANGTIYVENRKGAVRHFNVTINGYWGALT